MARIYKIKLEDKAALINKLEKIGITVDSYSMVDNKLEGYFEFEITNPVAIPTVNKVLKHSPKINQMKEMLQNMIREELKNIKNKG
jgi:hypothetical protein